MTTTPQKVLDLFDFLIYLIFFSRNDDSATKQEGAEKVDKQDKVPAVKFKEKKLPVTKQNNLNDTNVTFKKRKSNQDKKRSIRQRTDAIHNYIGN
jgi:hypothetical protein